MPHPPIHLPGGAGLDSLAVRLAMVARLEADGLHNPWVLQALRTVERHRFVDSALINQAYEDTSLPIGLGQTISKPGVVGRMLALMLQAQVLATAVPGAAGAAVGLGGGRLPGRVLEIGTGCGYQAALLSHLAVGVVSIERLAGLHERAKANLAPMGMGNLQLVLGDGMQGHKAGAPYLAIVAAAGGEAIPQAWIDQLAVGGRIVAPVHVPVASGQPARQLLTVVDKTPQGLRQQTLDGVMFVPLKSGVA